MWVTPSSGFQMIPKLPGPWVQIRNLQHSTEDRVGLGSSAWAETIPPRVVCGGHPRHGQSSAYSGQTTGSLARPGQDLGLRKTEAFCLPGPQQSSQKCIDLELREGPCREASEASPSPPGSSTTGLRAGFPGCVPARPPPSIASAGQEWTGRSLGLTHLCRAGRLPGPHGVAWAGGRQAKLIKVTSLKGSHHTLKTNKSDSNCPAPAPQIKKKNPQK